MSIYRWTRVIRQIYAGMVRGGRTFVMHTTTGTLNANAMARCSLDIPMSPALPPTIRMTQDGDPDVRPYNVVLRYRSCPARSIEKMRKLYAAWIPSNRTDR